MVIPGGGTLNKGIGHFGTQVFLPQWAAVEAPCRRCASRTAVVVFFFSQINRFFCELLGELFFASQQGKMGVGVFNTLSVRGCLMIGWSRSYKDILGALVISLRLLEVL